ncbi:MAG: ATP phosphoribosyltransferase [bacterium]|nr:ATP phosphoribosyltransferase [bacterium]
MKNRLDSNNITLAIQKKGRLTQYSIDLLEKAGLVIDTDGQKLYAKCRNFPLDIVFIRDEDIPYLVETGVVDIGIVGNNVVVEINALVDTRLPLDFGYCRLVIAVQNDSSVSSIRDLNNKKIATSYPRLVSQYLQKKKISVEIIQLNGSVELSPALNIASAIADLTSTGSTLAISDLRIIETLFESQAVLISQKKINNNKKQRLIDNLVFRFQAAQNAQKYKYIMMNAPQDKLKQIITMVPGLKSPTVTPLTTKGWVSIQTAIQEDAFWEKIQKLKQIGASGIIALPIEKLIT